MLSSRFLPPSPIQLSCAFLSYHNNSYDVEYAKIRFTYSHSFGCERVSKVKSTMHEAE
jgi:hypothetical protein